MKRDILPRIEIPGLPIPKIEPKPIVPIVPIVPRPVGVGVPNAPGRMPEIAPEPIPVPKPADPKPATPACKRADSVCAPDHTYTFSGIDYARKGQVLRERVQGAIHDGKVTDHNYDKEVGRYTMQIEPHAKIQLGNEFESFFKQHGIDMGNVFTRPTTWTRYQIHGTKDAKKISKNAPAVDVYVSVRDKAMIAARLFKNDPENELYDIPEAERLPMSEWLFQLWKKAVQDGQADYGVHINVGDLQKIFGKDISNPDTKAIIEKAQKDVYGNAQDFTIKPQDEATFNALSYSSSGISKWYMVGDHNSAAELNKLVPVQVDVTTVEKNWPMMVWTLSRS